jgi:hypothetical protein
MKMAKLNQVIAIERGIKSKFHSGISELYILVKKPVLFSGFSKTYLANDTDGEKLPAEQLRVQMTTDDALRTFTRGARELMQITARKDFTNCLAKADIVVDGATILEKVPVPYLLFLEKQLTDFNSFVKALPVLDEADDWNLDPKLAIYKTDPIQTHRTKKTQKPLTLAQATVEHPAQAVLITEDAISGYWSQVKMSGAMPKPDKQDLLRLIEKLHNAVKTAREAANMHDEVEVKDIGNAIFDYLLPTIKE